MVLRRIVCNLLKKIMVYSVHGASLAMYVRELLSKKGADAAAQLNKVKSEWNYVNPLTRVPAGGHFFSQLYLYSPQIRS